MTKTIELYVHTANGVDPKLVKTSEDATVKQLIEAIVASGGVHLPDDGGELRLFIEDYDEHLDLSRKLCECEIRHRHHVHCHSCHKVKVSVFYNEEKSGAFAPSVKVKQVLKWAIKEFKLSPTDAADKILVLKDNAQVELDLDAHIGSYANPRSCSINLCLTAPVEVQG